jgi:hypothetical protein
MKQAWKEGLLAWGTVNLLFFRRWSDLLPGHWDYLAAGPRSAVAYLSLMGLILVLSGIAWAAAVLVRRHGGRRAQTAVRAVFLLAMVGGIHGLLHEGWVYLGRPRIPGWVPWSTIALTLLTMGILQWRIKKWHRHVLPACIGLMMALSPLAPIMYAQGVYHSIAHDGEGPPWSGPPNKPPTGERGEHRVVWIVFDEFDQRIAFDDRPPDVRLPGFDRLINESFSSTHAYTPHAMTLFSIPSMTTGRITDPVSPLAPDRLQLTFQDDGTNEEFTDTHTIFHWANENDLDAAIIGFYHPYCRLFNELLVDCTYFDHYGGMRHGLLPHLAGHLQGLLTTVPTPILRDAVTTATALYTPLHEHYQRLAIETHQSLAPKAIETAARDDIDLAFIHLLPPHPAGLYGAGLGYYDPQSDDYATGTKHSYIDNLALADRTLKEIRRAMEENGTWNTITVIITSDHGYRATWWGENPSTRPYGDILHEPTTHRVPLIIKPAGDDHAPVTYQTQHNLYPLAHLVQHALTTGFSDPQEVAAWWDEQPPSGPRSHYVLT